WLENCATYLNRLLRTSEDRERDAQSPVPLGPLWLQRVTHAGRVGEATRLRNRRLASIDLRAHEVLTGKRLLRRALDWHRVQLKLDRTHVLLIHRDVEAHDRAKSSVLHRDIVTRIYPAESVDVRTQIEQHQRHSIWNREGTKLERKRPGRAHGRTEHALFRKPSIQLLERNHRRMQNLRRHVS